MDNRMPYMRGAEAVGNVSSKGSLGGPRGTELVGLGIFLAAAFLVPFVAGLALDALTHTSPLFLFVGLVVGIAAAVFGGYQRLKRYL
jgi:hypothetical protein